MTRGTARMATTQDHLFSQESQRRPDNRPGEVARPMSAAANACSVGVMAYNEETNIGDALDGILRQSFDRWQIAEVIVVASGCRDRTGEIVADIACRDDRVRLIEQENREGKASAVNLFIRSARSPVLILVGADVLVKEGSIEAMLRHFDDPSVGMVGGHPTPVNNEESFLGHAVHLQWRLHDRIAREVPKLGEIIAFRNVIPGIPLDSAVDEVSIESLITGLGHRLVYEPQAVVYNRGPATVGDFLRQRRRIHAGHLRVRHEQGYSPSTMSVRRAFRALWRSDSLGSPRAVSWTVGAIGLEATARALGHFDALRGRPRHVWDVCDTTKRHVSDGVYANREHSVAVFNIADFHRHELEVGLHASRQLTRRVAEQIKSTLQPDTVVTLQQCGTIVALLPGGREAAQESARQIVREFQASPFQFGNDGDGKQIMLTCGIVGFSPGESPLASSIWTPNTEAGRTAPVRRKEVAPDGIGESSTGDSGSEGDVRDGSRARATGEHHRERQLSL